MNKKYYQTPAMQVVNIEMGSYFCQSGGVVSGVSSNLPEDDKLNFADTGGSGDARSRGFGSFDDE